MHTSDRSTYSVGNREGGKSASRRPGEFVLRTISHNVRSLRQPEAIELSPVLFLFVIAAWFETCQWPDSAIGLRTESDPAAPDPRTVAFHYAT